MNYLLIIAVLCSFPATIQAQEGVSVKGNTISSAEIAPVWPGCETSKLPSKDCFNKMLAVHIKENFKYPKDSNGKYIQGKSTITFFIDENGKATKISAEGPKKAINEEVVRIVKLFPVMKPGTRGGKPVTIKYKMPFNF